ncbi:putative xylose isomerase domain protein TIM barrel [Burkholderia cenocepacia]|uniref:Xylose isomerase domain protein TIM barrel n=1 Tax=Burkholderia cenocepacia TaxID=95486 RepID=A0AAN0RR77_9BURK|nr:putative xylose isomerase domain protein TIM barrel [Burkholderia cenocepacia]
MAEPIRVGVNFDGVLEHDGLPTPSPAERFRMIAGAGVFDYVEKNPVRGEDLSPYFDLVQRHALPIRVIGGIWHAGRDEAHVAEIIDAGARFGSTVLNCQLHARHADGHPLSDREVADFYLRACERGEPAGCLPSLEVHVDMWSEDFTRVARVARHVEQAGAPFRITLDHSHLLFKIGNRAELDASGIRAQVESGRVVLDPASPGAVYADWIARGWVRHAHARSVMPGNPDNRWMRRADGRPGRGIQYPFVAPAPDTYHGAWRAASLDTWKLALRRLLQWQVHARPVQLEQISCEFIPFPDYGGGARYSIFDNNVACAQWLRDTWHALAAAPADTAALT